MVEIDCLFCKIVAGQIPAEIVKKSERVIAFNDVAPVAPTHILIIPNKHYESMAQVALDDKTLAGEILQMAADLAASLGLDNYRMNVNTGTLAGQSVFHAHLHLLSGRSFAWPPG